MYTKKISGENLTGGVLAGAQGIDALGMPVRRQGYGHPTGMIML
jgi:hypothetical protein